MPSTCPAHVNFLDLIALILNENLQVLKLRIVSFFKPPVTSSFLGPNIHLQRFPKQSSPVTGPVWPRGFQEF